MLIRSFMKSNAARQLLAHKRFAAFAVCRRYWRNNLDTVKKLGIQNGGEYVKGIYFANADGQMLSLLSLFSYLSKGAHRERYLEVRILPASLRPDYLEQA